MKGKSLVLIGWVPPLANEEAYSLYKACGFNTVFIDDNGMVDPEKCEKQLKYCDEMEIDAFPVAVGRGEPRWKMFPQKEDPIDYSSHKSFKGVLLWDEPDETVWEEVKKHEEYFQNIFPDKTIYLNTYCGQVSKANNEKYPADEFGRRYPAARATTTDYCDNLLEGLKGKKVLCFDYYGLCEGNDGKRHLRFDYLWTYDFCAKLAKERGYELWAYLQSAGIPKVEEDEKYFRRNLESVGDYLFQGLIAFCYGVNGLGAFTYRTFDGFAKNGLRGLANTADNGITESYGFVKRAHEILKDLFEEMSSYEYDGTGLLLGEKPTEDALSCIPFLINNRTEFSAVNINAEYSVVVGEFVNGMKRGYLMVNYAEPSIPLANVLQIVAKNGNELIVYKLGDRFKMKSGDTITLNNGEGFFVEI